ncbi:hypothetical protein SAMN05660826_02015 [Caldanaerovirga acetigignens]|uniref:Uncharacterized protein n=1 Tax=Caldanaerovirga acetigignens TaxID=447595 RepID=A0A1M7LSI7_9FIRM|nr:UPF0280 family protein [Caldanaerovirga acetigignens]SHM81223.1 hypothetical protein SAMN05660826_02015 [Caldanaerovirga acetigignens]
MAEYKSRDYRKLVYAEGLISFTVKFKETDLFISAKKDLSAEALACLLNYRKDLEEYIAFDPDFICSLSPHSVPEWAPEIVKHMAKAAFKAGVGPMAAVAGAISEFIGKLLLKFSPEVIVENGGDIFAMIKRPIKIGIFAGASPFSNKIALKLNATGHPLGICTSAGTIGHSLSFGRADAAVIVAENSTLADAVATATGNRVKSPNDIKDALEFALSIEGVIGALIIIGEHLGAKGDIEIEKI